MKCNINLAPDFILINDKATYIPQVLLCAHGVCQPFVVIAG